MANFGKYKTFHMRGGHTSAGPFHADGTYELNLTLSGRLGYDREASKQDRGITTLYLTTNKNGCPGLDKDTYQIYGIPKDKMLEFIEHFIEVGADEYMMRSPTMIMHFKNRQLTSAFTSNYVSQD
jgi:hypothetical protein